MRSTTVRPSAAPNYTPGMRVEIRDAEWRIQRVDHASDGGYVLTCEGQSELVRGRESLFLTRLEGDDIRILDPAETELVNDPSSNYSASLLFIASLLRRSVPSDEKLHQGHDGALDPLEFQYQPALQALAQPRQRILIADAVGLGKTLEAGILTAELMARGRGKRILVLAVKSMLAQFQQEFWNRFSIPLQRLDSLGLQRVRNRIPGNHNPFHYFDKSIISIDTLKQDIEYRHYLEQAWWDIIIIDEAHNVADRGSRSQRARLAQLLATRSDTLIMLSATPHDGKPESFASLVNMLDPTAIANHHDYAEEDFRDKGLVIRRFKKDVYRELEGRFPEREIDVARIDTTPAEEAAAEMLMNVSFHTLDGRSGIGQLFRTTLEKALFSSPAACLSTVENRMQRLEKSMQNVRDDEYLTTLADDHHALAQLAAALKKITVDQFSKYRLLRQVIADDLQWTGRQADDRLVIFTESLVTLDFLEQHLPGHLGLKKNQVGVLRGDMRDRELMQVVEDFGRRASRLRLLLCSDVAAEGINLHHQAHRMIHFDIPWSLMVFQQRNGRIDRYGQTRRPQIRYLIANSSHPRIRGDQRVLEVLIEKDNQAHKNIGDPSEFLGLYDQRAEEEKVAEVIEQGHAADSAAFDPAAAFAALMDDTSADSRSPLDNFIPAPPRSGPAVEPLPRLYDSELDFARAAIDWLNENGANIDADFQDEILALTAPADLRPRLRFLPDEARPEHDRFVLSPNARRVSESIRLARASDDSPWADVHYLWPLHPVMQWLTDRINNAFGRHAAPVVRVPDRLKSHQAVVLVHGGFPNRRGHLLVHDWTGVELHNGRVHSVLDWQQFQQRLDLRPGTIPNPGQGADTVALQQLLPAAVNAARRRLVEHKQRFQADRQAVVEQQQRRLEELKQRHEQQLQMALDRSRQLENIKQQKRQQGQSRIDRIFADYQNWLDNTQQVEDQPYLQVVAVFAGGPAASKTSEQ